MINKIITIFLTIALIFTVFYLFNKIFITGKTGSLKNENNIEILESRGSIKNQNILNNKNSSSGSVWDGNSW